MKHTQFYGNKRHITPRQESITASRNYLRRKKGFGKTQFIFEFIVFGTFFTAIIFGVPWMYYILTGNMMQF